MERKDIDYFVKKFIDELTKYELNLEGSFGMFKLRAKIYYKERE